MPAIENTDQAEYWNGDPGKTWVVLEDEFRHAIAGYLSTAIDGAGVQRGQNVLDLGCGGGDTTILAATRSETGEVLGLDLSQPLIERAREKAAAATLPNLRFAVGDAQSYPFAPASFNCAISRFGVMFFSDPVRAFANIRSGVSPGGRLSLVVWQSLSENEWLLAVREALAMGRDLPVPQPGEPGPFSLARPEFTRPVLEGAGWSSVKFTDLRVPYMAGDNVSAAFAFLNRQSVTRGLLEELDARTQEQARGKLRTMIENHMTERGVIFESAAWLVTAENTQ
jgi:SAM-dependent methyltransferase